MGIQEREICEASFGVKIKDVSMEALTAFMMSIIGKTFLSLGQKPDKETAQLTIGELCTDLVKYNGTLSCEEITIAFKNGYRGQYGEYFGLNNKTYFQWVNAYTWGESRTRAKKMMSDAQNKLNHKPEPTEAEKKAIIKQGAINCFEAYRTKGVLFDAGNVTYNFLKAQKLLEYPATVKEEIMAKAKEIMLNQETGKLTDPTYFGQHQSIKAAIEQIRQGVSVPLVSECKRLTVKRYFDNLIEMDEKLEDQL